MRGRFLLVLLLAVLGSCGTRPPASQTPIATEGVLDLTDHDFDSRGRVALVGDWEFYWKQLLTPAEFAAGEARSSGYFFLPGVWNIHEEAGQPVGGDGYATYRLKILLGENDRVWGLSFGDVYSAHAVYVNGERLGGRGTLATNEDDIRTHVAPVLYEFQSDGRESLEVILLQSNFNHARGSMEKIFLGPASELREVREQGVAFGVFVCGALVLMGVYHLFLFVLRREDRSPLLFGIICVIFAMFTMLTGQRYWIHLYPAPGHGFYWTVIYGIIAIAPPLFLSFVYSVFPRETSRLAWKVACLVGGLLTLFTLLAPAKLFTSLLSFYVMLVALSGGYCVFIVILASIRKRRESFLFLPGFLIFFAGSLNDSLHASAYISTGYYSGFTLVLFIFFQAAMLSMRFARAFHTVNNLTGELASKNRDLNRLDRLKNEFLANTSHELRTPLNGIIGIADSLREGAAGPLGEQVKHNLALIVYSGSRLAGLINDILDFQKLRNDDVSLVRRPVDLRQATDVVLAVSQPLIQGKDLVLRNELPEELPAVHVDENRLQQILHNLVGNAVKFTAEGEVVVSARSRDDMLEVRVSDTGIGIPEEKQTDIFQSFKQVDASSEREFGGTGLGLSISRRLVELHGGKIWVDSVPGEGAIFRFTLPTIDQPAPPSSGLSPKVRLRQTAMPVPPVTAQKVEPTLPPDLDPASRGRTILVVDDESLNRHVLANLLSVREYSVLEASDGVEALEVLERVVPDAILLDIMMPRMNGYEVCRKIREKYSPAELPVIFLSAKNEVEDLIAGLASGGNDYLSKPFAAPELLARVQSQTNLKRVHEEALGLREQLVDQEKLAAVGSMAAGIVHDFKTPVAIIKGYAELADDETVSRDERSQFLQIVTREADHLADMAQDILEYTKGVFHLNKRDVPVPEFLELVRKALIPYFAPKNIVYEVEAPYSGTLSVDPGRFVRVLINIAGNAADVMREGGVFEMKVEPSDAGVLLSLRDSGPGIPLEIQETLFEPFVTMGKEHGTGLGLAITKSIVEAHGGTIRFETGPEIGTTFLIELKA